MGENDHGNSNFNMNSMLPMLTMLGAQRNGSGDGGQGAFMMLLAIVLPLVLQHLMPKIRDAIDNFQTTWGAQPMRTIAYTRDPSAWWGDDKDDDELFNGTIQRAILKYINDVLPHVAKEWKQSDVQARKEEKSLAVGCSAGSEAASTWSDEESTCSTESHAASYLHFSYLCAPPNHVWVDLKNGIELERSVANRNPDANSGSRSRQITTTFKLRCSSRSQGPRKLNAFIDSCVEAYNAEQRKKVDASRYMYTPVLSAASASEDKTKTAMLYKKYKLADTRTFSSFFHPEKEQVLTLVDQFQNKRGKFAIPGYPVKLGFLLYGPPGTGKTSFIKALAHYTNRHIVNIPLSKIKTNQELMNLMFDQSIRLAGAEDGSATTLPHSKVIFVMEDVDAASSVVQRRDGGEAASSSSQGPDASSAMADAMAMAAAMVAAATSDASSSGTSTSSPTPSSGDSPSDPSSSSSADAGSGGVAEYGPAIDIPSGPVSWKSFLKDDKGSDALNLAGLLNVLDGVVDTPERIVVLTSNHPEKLDPALIRPGRINRKVYLGNVKLEQARSMIRHYFNSGAALEAEVEERLTAIFHDDVLSPATLESMCAEYDDVHDLITQLQAKMPKTLGPSMGSVPR